MAIMHCDFYSEALGMNTSMTVILPQTTQSLVGMESKAIREKHPALLLLHGISDDHTIWLRRTSIERYAAARGLAIVMPSAGRSFYTDMKHGYKYGTFIGRELPEIARSFFPLSESREDNFIAGLSMGGYGALKLGLANADRFAAIASLSGVVDVPGIARMAPELKPEFETIFGDPDALEGSEHDLFRLLERAARSDKPLPRIYQCCGTEDFLYPANTRFRDLCRELSVELTYEEGPGAHEWGYWDKMIQNVLQWLPMKSQ